MVRNRRRTTVAATRNAGYPFYTLNWHISYSWYVAALIALQGVMFQFIDIDIDHMIGHQFVES